MLRSRNFSHFQFFNLILRGWLIGQMIFEPKNAGGQNWLQSHTFNSQCVNSKLKLQTVNVLSVARVLQIIKKRVHRCLKTKKEKAKSKPVKK